MKSSAVFYSSPTSLLPCKLHEAEPRVDRDSAHPVPPSERTTQSGRMRSLGDRAGGTCAPLALNNATPAQLWLPVPFYLFIYLFFVFFVADEMLKHFLSCSTLIALIAADVKIPSGWLASLLRLLCFFHPIFPTALAQTHNRGLTLTCSLSRETIHCQRPPPKGMTLWPRRLFSPPFCFLLSLCLHLNEFKIVKHASSTVGRQTFQTAGAGASAASCLRHERRQGSGNKSTF